MSVEHHVEAVYTVNPKQALGALGKIASAAEKTNRLFDHVSETLGAVASVAGAAAAAFSFEKIVESTKEHLEMVKRISLLTGTTVKNSDALVDTFEQVGLRGEDAENILLSMSRRSAMMDMSMQRMGRTTGNVTGLMRGMGINLKNGPEQALLRMSNLYQQHKVDIAQVGLAMGIPRQQWANLALLLENGPKHLKEMLADSKKLAVGEGTVKQMERMNMAMNSARSAIKRMQVAIGSELLPVLADLLEDASAKIKSWLPEVKRFASFLRDNLYLALNAVVKIGKVLLANYAVMKASAALSATGMIKGGGFGIGGLAGRVGSYVAGSGGGLQAVGLVRLLSVIGRLSVVAGVILLIVTAFEVIKNNTLGVRDYILGMWKRLQGHIAVIAKLVTPIFGPEGVLTKFFSTVVVGLIEGLATAVDGLMQLVETLVIYFKNAFSSFSGYKNAMLHPMEALGDAAIQAARLHKEAMKTQAAEVAAKHAQDMSTPEGRATNHYDFRNSRFDIMQKFEEGYDPDRIALAFSNDLASLGERRMESMFSTPFAKR
jgi:hypothetical protein